MSQSVTSSMYDGIAELGKAQAKMSLWFGTIVSIIMMLIGLYLVLRKKQKYDYIDAQLLSIENCTRSVDKNSNNKPINNYDDCTVNVEFIVNNTTYKPSIYHRYSNNELLVAKNNKTIGVYYNVINPNDITFSNPQIVTIIGAVLIIVAILIFVGSYYNNKLVDKNKSYAAYNGAQTMSNGFSSMFTPLKTY
jgi:hypothetical protein